MEDIPERSEAEHELISTSLEVEQLDTNLFRSKSLWVPSRARGVFGGQVISQALVSGSKTVEPDYALHVSDDNGYEQIRAYKFVNSPYMYVENIGIISI